MDTTVHQAPGNSYDVTVDDSQVTGATAAIQSINKFTMLVGASLLDGAVNGGGTLTCIKSFDASMSSLDPC